MVNTESSKMGNNRETLFSLIFSNFTILNEKIGIIPIGYHRVVMNRKIERIAELGF